VDAAARAPRVALVHWGNVIEDYLDAIGLDFEDFRTRMTGGWMFGYLAALRDAGVEPILVCITRSVTSLTMTVHTPTGVRVAALPPTRAYELVHRATRGRRRSRALTGALQYLATPLVRVHRVLRSEGCDTVLVQEYESPRFDVLVRLSRRTGRRAFATYQGGNTTSGGRWGRWIEAPIRRRSMRRADGFVIASAAELDRVATTYGVGTERLAHIPNPVMPQPPVDRAQARRRLGLAADDAVVVWHGRVEIQRKGLDVLLEAWARVRAELAASNPRLVLLGSGGDAAELHRRLDASGFDDVLWIDEFVNDRTRITEVLAVADVYAFASPHEGFAVAPAEAMALGVPVVATSAPGVVDLLPEGEASGGIVVPVGDVDALAAGIVRLLRAPELARTVGQAARTRVDAGLSLAAVGAGLRTFLFGGESESPATCAPPADDVEPLATTPTFSVIMAVHDAATTIGEALTSALEQVPPPLEVIVCDDGSTDDLEGALAPFRSQIRLVRKEQGGEASAKNRAAAEAVGDFVVILDADDRYLPGRLAALGALAQARPDLDILTTDAHFEVGGESIGRCYRDDFTFEVDDQRTGIIRRNFVFGLAAIRRTRFAEVGGFSEDVRHSADWDCWVRLILSGSRAGLVTAPLAAYRLHESSMNADRLSMYRGRRVTLERVLGNPDATEHEREVARGRIAAEDRRIALEELNVALDTGDRAARDLGLRLLRMPAVGRGTRLRAAAAVVAPRVAGAVVHRRRSRYWRAAGDVRLPRS
jgi:glycosyltransferase involved in cell wall biosynthesis/GT2 family glycosyltransferase